MQSYFSKFFPAVALYVVLAICVALQYNVQHWTRVMVGLSKTCWDAGTALMAVNDSCGALPSSVAVSVDASQCQTDLHNKVMHFSLILSVWELIHYFCPPSVQSLFLILKFSESCILLSYLQQQALQCCPGVFTSTCPDVNERGRMLGQPL